MDRVHHRRSYFLQLAGGGIHGGFPRKIGLMVGVY
jgi:hypothetical protein